MTTKIDNRQSRQRSALDQLDNNTDLRLDTILNLTNDELTMPLRMRASSSPNQILNIDAVTVTTSDSGSGHSRSRSIPPISNVMPTFTGGTVTFPSANNNNITNSTGGPTVLLNITASHFIKVGINLNALGQVQIVLGTSSAVSATATVPPVPSNTFGLGYITVQNVAGTISTVTNANIVQYVGGGGGSGSGNASSTLETLKNQWVDNPFSMLTPNIISTDGSTKIDGTTTATYSLVNNTYSFTAASQFVLSTQMLDQIEFLSRAIDVTDIDLSLFWKVGSEDTAATYQVSRNGGTDFQAVSMTRIGSTEVYRGALTFVEEAASPALQSNATMTTTQALNATTQQKLDQSFTLAATSVIRNVKIEFNKTSSPVGYAFVQIVKDNAGSPSTSDLDVVAESSAIDIASIAAGDSQVSVAMPRTVLAAGTYHLVLRTDAAYKAGSLTLNWRSNGAAGTGAKKFDGSAWTSIATTTFGYTVDGYALDLRVKVISSASGKELAGYGIFYEKSSNGVNAGSMKIERRSFNSVSENFSTFTLTQFLPDPNILSVYWVEGGQVFKWPAFTVNGYQITFPTNTFNNGGVSQTISLVFDQTGGASFDATDSNANSIATINNWAGSQVDDVVLLSKVAAPYTSIINRAKMVDLSQDLGLRMGIERIPAHQTMRVEGETGPNNEPIFKLVNDKFEQARFGGQILTIRPPEATFGQSVYLGNAEDFFEFSFYGTGLNVLALADTNTRAIRISTDGGSGTDVTISTNSHSSIIVNRNYQPNQVVNLTGPLTLGFHTVKGVIQTGFSLHILGFEILNDSSQIKVNPGISATKGKKLTLSSQHSSAYNSVFTNQYGTAGTKGGHVVVYQHTDGTIRKDVQWTDVSSLTLTSTSHANEEVIRNYYWREFGAARSAGDDFSTLTAGASQRAFTLDDGVTTLATNNTQQTFFGSYDLFYNPSTNDYTTFTFVGTGLDIMAASSGASTDPISVSINGAASSGNISATGNNVLTIFKIASGLPYGQHTVKFTRTASALNAFGFMNFIVYGPKKPVVPVGTYEIGDYNLMADYVGGTPVNNGTSKSIGVLSKTPMKEVIYIGGPGVNLSASYMHGFGMQLNAAGSAEITFSGTGVEVFAEGGTGTISIDDVLYTGAASHVAASGGSWTPGTSTWVTGTSGRLAITGLSAGVHKIKWTYVSGAWFLVAFNIITPVHVHKNNGPLVTQNTLAVGSQGISDSRKFGSQISTVGQLSRFYPITQSTTTSTTEVPIGVMAPIYLENDALVSCQFHFALNGQGGQNTAIVMYVDGVRVENFNWQPNATGNNTPMILERVIPMTKGWHFLNTFWRTALGTVGMPNLASGGTEYGCLSLRKVN